MRDILSRESLLLLILISVPPTVNPIVWYTMICAQIRNKNATTSSSHTAQRLQAYVLSKFPEKQLDLYQDILESYHIQGVYPAHIPTLASIAVKHQIFPSIESATEWLEGDEFEKDVQRGYNDARGMGVTGVPFFVFQGKYAASGAMGEGEFVHVRGLLCCNHKVG